MSGRKADTPKKKQGDEPPASGDDVATYAFDMLQSLRGSCSQEKHRFLSYLIGMAVEEAQRLAEGQPSAGAAFAKPTIQSQNSKNH